MDNVEPSLRRAGFWQRTVAYIIDIGVVLGPISVLAGVLFFASDGAVQMSSPLLSYQQCQKIDSYPDDLQPKPPADSTFAQRCVIYSLGGITANLLMVVKQTQDGATTTTTTNSYYLNRNGKPVGSQNIDLNWIAQSIAILTIIVQQCYFGRTIGQRVMSTRMVALEAIQRQKIDVPRVLLRYFLIFIYPLLFFVPLLGLLIFSPSVAALVIVTFCVGPLAIWIIGNLGLIVQRKDPWFDRWSGLAEVEIGQQEPVVRPPPSPARPPPLPHP